MKRIIIVLIMILLLYGCSTTSELSKKKRHEGKFANQEQILHKITKCKEEVPRPRVGSPGWGAYYGAVKRKNEVCHKELDTIWMEYMGRLLEVMKSDDPGILEIAYKEWETNNDLQVIYEIATYDSYYGSQLASVRTYIEQSSAKFSEERNEILLQGAYWKLAFIKGPNRAQWVESMISDRRRKLEADEEKKREMEAAEERRKQEQAIAEQKRRDEMAAQRAKEKEDAAFALAHPDVSNIPGIAGNLPPNSAGKAAGDLALGGKRWHNKNGFGDLKWGIEIRTLIGEKDSLGRVTKRDGNAEYSRTGDGLRYYFFNGKFYGVGMLSYMPAQRMFSDLAEDYGQPIRTGGGLGFQTAEWDVGNVKVILKGGRSGFTVYWVYMPMASKAADSLLQKVK